MLLRISVVFFLSVVLSSGAAAQSDISERKGSYERIPGVGIINQAPYSFKLINDTHDNSMFNYNEIPSLGIINQTPYSFTLDFDSPEKGSSDSNTRDNDTPDDDTSTSERELYLSARPWRSL